MKDKIAVISGIGGFIGSNLAGLLIEQGTKVTGIPRDLLSNPEKLQTFLEEVSPNYIFHLAAYGNHHGQDDEDETFSANVIKTYLLLKASLNVGYNAFLNFSTSSVYGISDEIMKESDALLTDSFYGCTKVAGEYMAKAITKRFEKPICNIRPFSVYGPGEATHRFIPTVIRNIQNDEVIKLYPNAVHDWIYVEDVIEGVFTILSNIERCTGNAVNIGTGRQYSNLDVVDKLKALSKKDPKIEMLTGERENDTEYIWRANVSFLQSFGWYPKHTLDEGLAKAYAYYTQPKEEPTLRDAFEKSLDMSGQGGFKNFGKPNKE